MGSLIQVAPTGRFSLQSVCIQPARRVAVYRSTPLSCFDRQILYRFRHDRRNNMTARDWGAGVKIPAKAAAAELFDRRFLGGHADKRKI